MSTKANLMVCRLSMVFLLASGVAAAQTDPGSQPIPIPQVDQSKKTVVVKLDYTGDTGSRMVSAEVARGPSGSKTGNPQMVRVESLDYRGNLLGAFHEWDPRWVFHYGEDGHESLAVVPKARVYLLVPFVSDLEKISLFNVRDDQDAGTFDLGPAVREFCDAEPEDPDCEVADLQVLRSEVHALPPFLLVGDSETIDLRTVIRNAGPDAPIDALLEVTATSGPGLAVAPASNDYELEAVGLDEQRSVEESYTVTCVEPGRHTLSFLATIDATKAAVHDPDPSNDEYEVTVEVDCAVHVTINIKPASWPNSINWRTRNTVSVAVLTTAAGEYGNPLAFDATTIDPLSARFGPPAVVAGGGGSVERHGRGHVEDSVELDEKTRDGDADLVLHFPNTGFRLWDTEGCVKGLLSTAAGSAASFIGCDSVRMVP